MSKKTDCLNSLTCKVRISLSVCLSVCLLWLIPSIIRPTNAISVKYTVHLLTVILVSRSSLADVTQFPPTVTSVSHDVLTRLSACIDEVATWMRSRPYSVTTTKPCENRNPLVYNQLTSSSAAAATSTGQLPGSDHTAPASVVRELEIYIDSDISMKSHVAKTTVSTCYAVLHLLRTIRVGQRQDPFSSH